MMRTARCASAGALVAGEAQGGSAAVREAVTIAREA